MTTEERILKQILENGGEASLQIIVKKLGMGSAYISYLCKILAKKDLVKNLESKDWYKITRKGWKELEKLEKSIREYPFKKHISRKKKTRITKRSRRPKKKITKKPKRKPRRKVNKKIPKPTKTKRKSPKTKAKKKIIKKVRAKRKSPKTSANKKKTKTSARLGIRRKKKGRKKKARIYPSIAKPRTSVSFAAYQENKITEGAPIIREELKTEEPKIEEKAQEEIKPKETTSPEKKFKKVIESFKNLFRAKKD